MIIRNIKETTSFLLSFIFSCQLSSCVYAQRLHIFPSDPAVCVGTDVTFRCSVADDSVSFKEVHPVIITQNVELESELKDIGDHSAELILYNVNEKHDHLAVCCILDDDNCDLFSVSILNVYPLPVEVQNFSCVVESYIKSMNCSWNYGKVYGPFKDPEVQLKWKMLNMSTWNNCSDLNRDYGYCYWENSQTDKDFTMKEIQIRLTVKQTCNISATSDFQIDTSKIVKPYPVVGLSSKVLNSTCIHIMWNTASSEKMYPKEHRVVISSKWGDDQLLRFTTTKETESLTKSETVCNLHPYTCYNFTVSTQPSGQQAGYFSDPKAIVAVTYSDKPSDSPKVTKGGYHWYRNECEGSSITRRVCIFWKPLREDEKNGDIRSLQGTFNAIHSNRTSFQKDWAEDLTYGCIDGLLCNTSYNFVIRATNVNGTSEKGSTMLISSKNSGLFPPKIIVETNSMDQIYVSFLSAVPSKANGFMVAWCRNHNGDCKTNNEVQWKYFPLNTIEAVIKIDPTDSPQDFFYGVSVLTEKGSSGLEWQDCVYMKNKEPSRVPVNVVVKAGPDDNTLVVSWDKLACESDEPYIAVYNVQYNKSGDGCRNSQNITSSDEARLVLKDLEEDQMYDVTVRGVTKDGRYGPESPSKKGIPLNRSLKTGAIVGIIMAALVSAVLMGIIGCGIFWICKKKAKNAIQKTKKITIPDIEYNEINGNSDNKPLDICPSSSSADEQDECLGTGRTCNSSVYEQGEYFGNIQAGNSSVHERGEYADNTQACTSSAHVGDVYVENTLACRSSAHEQGEYVDNTLTRSSTVHVGEEYAKNTQVRSLTAHGRDE